jgi:hypothetical protein
LSGATSADILHGVRKVIGLVIIIAALVVAGLGWFGPAVQVRKILYYSPVWSPDGKAIAFFKRSMEYTHTKPVIDLPFITPDTPSYNFTKDSLVLAEQPATGGKERVIRAFKLSLDKEDPGDEGGVNVKLGWYSKRPIIQYCVVSFGFKNDLDTGNHFINPDGSGDSYQSPSFDAKTKIVDSFPTTVNNKELWPDGGSKAIFEFDNLAKKVTLLLGDSRQPLPKYTSPALRESQ